MPKEIVVIGAGASGLMAAAILSESKYKVSVIEARDRIGGRVHSVKDGFSRYVETGAEFVHGDQPLTRLLAKNSRRDISAFHGKWYQYKDGNLGDGDPFEGEWNELHEALGKLKIDTDISSFLNSTFKEERYREFKKGVQRFVEGFDAADVHRISAFALRDEWSETESEQYHIVGGYASLLDDLKERLIRAGGGRVVLSSPVEEIQWSKGKVKLITTSGSFDAEKVIVTVPIGILQKGIIHFKPALPFNENVFNKIGFGGVIKIMIEFKEKFWEDSGSAFRDMAFLLSDAQIPTWWTQAPDDIPLLTGWLGGPSSFHIIHSPGYILGKAKASLQYIFKLSSSELDNMIKTSTVADWVTDPYSQGAYAYATVETNAARKFLTQPIDHTIYFAGEALYDGPAMGTVEAALVSGEEVAKKIMAP
jgi:monoamine oxidase